MRLHRVDAGQLLQADRRLQVHHVVLEAGLDDFVLRRAAAGVARPRVAAHAVQRQHPDALGPIGAVGRDHAALAGRDVLHGVEAEGGEIGGGADAPRSGGGAERVRGVVDDRQAVTRGDAAEAGQRRRPSREVHRQERRRARA